MKWILKKTQNEASKNTIASHITCTFSTSACIWKNIGGKVSGTHDQDKIVNKSFSCIRSCLMVNWESYCNKYSYTVATYVFIRFTLIVPVRILTPLLLCALILYVSGRTYSLTSTLNDRFWETFLWQVNLLSEFLSEICWDEIAEEIVFFPYFVLMPDLVYKSGLYV